MCTRSTLTLFWLVTLLVFLFLNADTTANTNEPSRQAKLLAGHFFFLKLFCRDESFIYQRYVASAVSLNMQHLLKAGSIIQGAITGCKSKKTPFAKLCVKVSLNT